MKKLKKIMLLTLCAFTLFGTTACGSRDNADNGADQSTTDTKDNGILDDAVNDVTNGVDDITDDVTDGVDKAADDMTEDDGGSDDTRDNR